MSENTKFKKLLLEGYLGTTKITQGLEETLKATNSAKALLRGYLDIVVEEDYDFSAMPTDYLKALTLLKSVEENLKDLNMIYKSSLSENLNHLLRMLDESTSC